MSLSLTCAGAVLVAGLAAACSGGGGEAEAAASQSSGSRDDQFCSGARALYDEFAASDVTDPASPEARQVFTEAQQLDPPAEIAEAWEQSLAVLEPLVSGEIDPHDPDQVAQLGARAAEIDGERLETYFAEECPMEPSSATSATP